MARDVSSLRPARPRVRLQDLDRLTLLRRCAVVERLLKEAIAWDGSICENQDDPQPSWKEEAQRYLGL